MTPEQADAAREKLEDLSASAEAACEAWCRDEVKHFVVPLPPWGEAEEPPASDGNPADQYRFWLWETERSDSPKARLDFEAVLYEWQIERWEQNKAVEWWHEADDDEPRERD